VVASSAQLRRGCHLAAAARVRRGSRADHPTCPAARRACACLLESRDVNTLCHMCFVCMQCRWGAYVGYLLPSMGLHGTSTAGTGPRIDPPAAAVLSCAVCVLAGKRSRSTDAGIPSSGPGEAVCNSQAANCVVAGLRADQVRSHNELKPCAGAGPGDPVCDDRPGHRVRAALPGGAQSAAPRRQARAVQQPHQQHPGPVAQAGAHPVAQQDRVRARSRAAAPHERPRRRARAGLVRAPMCLEPGCRRGCACMDAYGCVRWERFRRGARGL